MFVFISPNIHVHWFGLLAAKTWIIHISAINRHIKMCVDEGHIKFVVYCCCLFSLQHLGQCGMYRNHSLNTGLDQSRVWWLLYSNHQPYTGSQPLLSWSRFFLIFQRNIGLCLKIMSPLLNHPVFLCVCNNTGILFPVFYHHF